MTERRTDDETVMRDRAIPLLGKQVNVRYGDALVARGRFLGFGEDGEFELLADDGIVYHAWPLLDIEAVETQPSTDETDSDHA